MKRFVTALMICTLSAGAWAEKGLVTQTRTDAQGNKTIVIKDFRPKKKRPLKRQPAFKEYDLGQSNVEYSSPAPSAQPVMQNYAPQPMETARQPVQRVQTYSQTYSPGPNKTMSPGGGGGAFASTVLPTAPYWGWGYGYGQPWYGNCNNYGPFYPAGARVVPGVRAVYPNTYPGFMPGLPSGPPAITGYPVFNTVSPPIVRPVLQPGPYFIR
ncbi:MAG: hypothetical protein AMXMBFR33_21060 [Candidatus Xenobia bacterium]|jgi:hypothetical protein